MREYVKLLLFISAYTPLFLILFIQYIQFLSPLFIVSILLLALINSVWFVIFYISKSWTVSEYTVKKSVNRTSDALNYIIAYIVTFIGFKFNTWQDYLSLAILLVIIFFIYVNSDLIFVNPMLNVIGFKIISVEVKEGGEIVLITKNSTLKDDDKIAVKNITDNIYFTDSTKVEEDKTRSEYENKEVL